MRRFFTLLVVAAVVALPAPVKAAEVALEATDNKFVPETLTLNAGDTLLLKNTGKALHNAVAKDGSFKSEDVAAGQETKVQITKGGTISFVCTYHEAIGMKGTLEVAGGAGGEAGSEASKATDEKEQEEGTGKEKEEEETEGAGDKPPVEKYFPPVAGLLVLLMFPLIGLAWRKNMKSPAASRPEPAASPEE